VVSVDAGAGGEGRTLFADEIPYVMLWIGEAMKLLAPGRFVPVNTGGWLDSVTTGL